MGAREPETRKPILFIADEASPVPVELYGSERPANDAVLIAEDKPGLPADSFKKWAPGIEIKPGEMWPDGKVRPRKIKAASGETIWLTEEEYEALVLEARHRARANKVGPSTAPRPKLNAGESVELRFIGNWPPVLATVRKIKGDGRVIIEHVFCTSELTGKLVKINGIEYAVLRSSGGTMTIRLPR